MYVVCIHTYADRKFSFYLGQVKLDTLRVHGKMHGIRNCSAVFQGSCPSHSNVLSPLPLLFPPLTSVPE